MFIPLLFTIPIAKLCYYNHCILCYYKLNNSIILWYNNGLLCNGSYCQWIRASRGTQYKIQNAITNNYFIFCLLVIVYQYIYLSFIYISVMDAGQGQQARQRQQNINITGSYRPGLVLITISVMDHTTVSYILYKYICVYTMYIIYNLLFAFIKSMQTIFCGVVYLGGYIYR